MWQLRFHWGDMEGLGREQRPALTQLEKKKPAEKRNYFEDIILDCLDMLLSMPSLRLNQRTPMVRQCYSHVNMAQAVAASTELVVFINSLERKVSVEQTSRAL